MSAPVRFLAVVLAGWCGVRAWTLGFMPGLTITEAKALPVGGSSSPIVATEFPQLAPVEPTRPPEWAQYAQYAPAMPQPVRVRAAYYYLPYAPPAPAYVDGGPIPPRPQWQLPASTASAPAFFDPIAPVEQWELGQFASAAFPARRSSPVPTVLTQDPVKPRLDRVQLSSWALLRGNSVPGTLAAGGNLGGSQAGARLTYALNRVVAASLRTASPLGGSQGAEIAGGVRVTPFRSIPVAVTAERRQSISRFGGGRSAFALFIEGGVYRQAMPMDFTLDAYVQAGLVGLHSRDYFADGALVFSRPVWDRVSAGVGVWGGAQPGLYRIDAGPRLSYRVRDNIYVHADWRQRVAGTALPASGPALTLAADF